MSLRPSRVAPAVAVFAALACAALPAHAQFGGGGRRRPPSGASDDSADGRPRRDPNTINTVDVIIERRGDLGLTPEQAARVSAAKTRRDAAVDTLSARAAALRPPSDPNVWATMSDSDRVAMRDRLRARAAALRAQRDAEAQAREEALAALTPEQRARAQKIEDDMRKSAFAEARLGGAARGNGPGGAGGRGGPP
ncbi:hypothetical protein tb265_18740 [Gemmatimonadetes bacterium T265]|nr:hypothetical protein tb265_18740 [Gemmatimonadetes bacterium T265]